MFNAIHKSDYITNQEIDSNALFNYNCAMKNIFLAPIKGYQYISKMLPASCRYYPTCSEDAKWQLEFSAPHRALESSRLRI